MKTSDVKIGTRCWTNVGQNRVEVEVIQDRGGRGRRYVLKRVDNGTTLQSPRAATALHVSRSGEWSGAFAPAERPHSSLPSTPRPGETQTFRPFHACVPACERHLDEIDAWRTGRKATLGQPSGGQNYSRVMVENVLEHVRQLRALGHFVPTDKG